MKKLFLSILFSFVLIFSIFINCYADEGIITESPDIKILIDGKQGVYNDVPLIVNGRTLLPLRAILVDLGVKNDDRHIVWNDSEKSVTVFNDVYKGQIILTTKISLKIGSGAAFVNDLRIDLDASPVIYNDRTYIPARFVAQTLGKKVVWDDATRTVIIRDEYEFNRIKGILEKSDEAMDKAARLKLAVDMNMKLADNGSMRTVDVKMALEKDGKKKTAYLKRTSRLLGVEINNELYYGDNKIYKKGSFKSVWDMEPLRQSDYEQRYKSETSILGTGDALFAGLVSADNAVQNELVLKGDICSDEQLSKLNDINGTQAKFSFERYHIKIVLDRSTYLIKSLNVSAKGMVEMNSVTSEIVFDIKGVYGDYNGSFEVYYPEELGK